MNWDRLKLSRRPFRATPALDQYVPLPGCEAAIGALRSAFAGGSGLALLDGAPGTGKSLVALRFLESLGSEVLPIYVPSARFGTVADLHRSILFDLGRDYRGIADHELRLALVDLFLKSLADAKRAVVVLDEAQHLEPDVLEELRLLDNWDARGTKAAFTLLVGQPELRERLARPVYELIAGRIDGRARLERLADGDARTLIRTQLEACTRRADEMLSEEALELIVRHGRGNPRLLNRLAAASLEMAAANGLDGVDLEVAYEALSASGIEVDAEPAGPTESVEPGKSPMVEIGEAQEGRESKTGRSPKQKARNRRAA
jgi:type II secretory pathway predicted ATPase ExeA